MRPEERTRRCITTDDAQKYSAVEGAVPRFTVPACPTHEDYDPVLIQNCGGSQWLMEPRPITDEEEICVFHLRGASTYDSFFLIRKYRRLFNQAFVGIRHEDFDAQYAEVRNVEFRGFVLDAADFEYAEVRDTVFRNGSISFIALSGAWRRVRFENCVINAPSWVPKECQEVEFVGCQVPELWLTERRWREEHPGVTLTDCYVEDQSVTYK